MTPYLGKKPTSLVGKTTSGNMDGLQHMIPAQWGNNNEYQLAITVPELHRSWLEFHRLTWADIIGIFYAKKPRVV